MKRLKVLLSAYACEPGKGSEPGVGWNVAREMAKRHDLWVLTRSNNRDAIEAAMEHGPVPGLNFIYHDLPEWARWWKRGGRGVRAYYYIWQLTALPVVRRAQREVGFDLAHHVTFVKYWTPSVVAALAIPFVWGPVGGGESAPRAFWRDLGPAGERYERLRKAARWLGERDALVRLTARRSRVALATTDDTASRLHALGARNVRTLSQVAVGSTDVRVRSNGPSELRQGIRFLSVGRLLPLKGFHLGLRAFAEAALQGAEYWIIGSGPDRGRLEALTAELGITGSVRFLGEVPREQVLDELTCCTALVHPSLHDSGGWVSLEAMAASRPVICLDLGGPGVQVTPDVGFKIAAGAPGQSVRDMAAAMRAVAKSDDLRRRLGEAGRTRVLEVFSWGRKGEYMDGVYAEAMGTSS